jgi:hypothetical protein
MGYMVHHTIIVTGFDEEKTQKAHTKAAELFQIDRLGGDSVNLVSPIVGSVTNGYLSFFIAPDGSKGGWATSDAGDSARKEFIRWLEDNETRCSWVEIQYDDDDGPSKIVSDSKLKSRGEE